MLKADSTFFDMIRHTKTLSVFGLLDFVEFCLVRIRACVRACACVRVYAYVRVYVRVRVCVCVCVCVRACACTHVNPYSQKTKKFF